MKLKENKEHKVLPFPLSGGQQPFARFAAG